jgi:hypothetical protein
MTKDELQVIYDMHQAAKARLLAAAKVPSEKRTLDQALEYELAFAEAVDSGVKFTHAAKEYAQQQADELDQADTEHHAPSAIEDYDRFVERGMLR